LKKELETAGSDVKRYTAAYEKLQAAQQRVDDLYARWAELEAKVAR
jgi:exonuclease VII small subunit